MNDEVLIAQSAALPVVYVDGFGAYRKVNGVLRCVGYIIETGAQLNLFISLAGAEQAQIDAEIALHGEPAGKEWSAIARHH